MYACTLQLDSAECTIASGKMKKRLASLQRDFYWESQDDGISWFDADYKRFMTQLFRQTSWKVRWYRLMVSHVFQRISKVNCKWEHWPSTTCKDCKGGEDWRWEDHGCRFAIWLFSGMLPTCRAGARVMARVLWCLAAVAAGSHCGYWVSQWQGN